MSSIRSAIADDEDEWYQLAQEANVSDMRWDVYSLEADHARLGFRTLGLTGARLKLHVRHEMELVALRRRHLQEQAEYDQYILLGQKFSR
jgi:hypothetical protein